MTSKSIRPSTMAGLKRLAKQIKIAERSSHHAALDQAARAAGFENFRHAQRTLPDQDKPRIVATYTLYLTAYWHDRQAGTSGRETLAISLGAPWSELLTREQFYSARGLGGFQTEGPDHLSRRHVARSQESAREAVCHAARTLQFVDATRLRPSRGSTRAYPSNKASNPMPGQDHAGVWYDSEKRYLIADEPYEKSVEHQRAERDAWCRRHGYEEMKCSWLGMHNPFGGTRLYLLSSAAKGVRLQPVIEALNRLPEPYSAADWKGESAPRYPYFVSPGTSEAEAARKVRKYSGYKDL